MMARLAATGVTFRMRLTLAFAALALGAGALIIALLYLFMRFVPTYLIATVDKDGTGGELSEVSPRPTFGETGATAGDGGIVITDVASILETLLWAGILILIVMAVIAGWVGWVIAGRVMRPLQRIRDAAKSAGEGRLDHRIGLDGPDDEVRDLAETFDHTLDRLEKAFTAHQRFASNAAHELRTPLTATKVLLDVAAAHPGDVDYAGVLAQIEQNNTRSIGLIQALLDLTALEAASLSFESVDLATIAESVGGGLRSAGAVGRSAAPAISATAAPVRAEPVLLTLLVENLAHNAVRHNDDRGLVSISTGSDARDSWIRVENTGALLTDAEVQQIVEPLHRGRNGDREGYGLGLTIARTIAESHDALLELTPREGGGLIATVRLPSRSAAPAMLAASPS